MILRSSIDKDLLRVGDVAKILGVTNPTVHKMLVRGEIPFIELPTSNHRRVKAEDLIVYLNEKGLLYDDVSTDKCDIVYARVSTHKQKSRGDLKRQIENVVNYAVMQNPKNLKVITDVASGLNDNRTGLKQLLAMVLDGCVDRIFINYKDRLTRFGFGYIEQVCQKMGTSIIIVSSETDEKSLEFELAEDIITIIHSFSGKLYGMRRKVKDSVNEVLTDEIS